MSKKLNIIKYFLLAGCLIFGTLVYLQRQVLIDDIKLLGYATPADISSLAKQDTFSAKSEHLFYINHPDLLSSRQKFDSHCPSGGEKTIVLGCYIPGESGIYLYAVNDPKLNGVEQVTAAHEMLHAAYERLSSSERSYVNGLLEDYYKHDLKDPRLLSVIAAYQKSEPSDVVNEMHSVFGTEIMHLTPQLEAYYKQYFANRQTVANFAVQYEKEFTDRENQVQQYDVTLNSWDKTIKANEADLNSRAMALKAELDSLTAERNSGDFTSYNSDVATYNSQVDAYNSELSATKNLIAEYNQLVDKRNAIALQTQQLDDELSGKLPRKIQ